ncbi:MAG: bifunctional folylpolyglutamate synthase/dihydrofolate synthase, partial [Candidatus Omnitrophica bacterium]|nr:bifunctional folylpolyglutamate synthase/dihydrofolate synthase [Candidatus Omnitrophota bacterium]
STCAFLTYILREAGYKVGLYTSPHLMDFRERIRILSAKRKAQSRVSDFEGMISRKALADLVNRIKPSIEKYNRISRYGPLTYFEVCTALAFQYFSDKSVDFAVLETGLGGRLDATNVVTPLVSVITPISYEHTQKLGKTLAKIAGEKAGIIKPGVVLICAPQKKEALDVIRKRCKEKKSRLYLVSKIPSGVSRVNLSLIGEHQKINAAVSVAAVEVLKNEGVRISSQAINRGLSNTRWPGRCEIISKVPLVVLDGAQNAASAKVLKKAVKDNFKYKKLILVLGISSDKDIKGICRELKGLADKVILTCADTPRAAPVNKLADYFRGMGVLKTDSVKQAMALAKKISGKFDMILVTGSLFIAGEARC